MRMILKKWMLRVVKDLEIIVSKHPERICLGNQTNLLRNKVIARTILDTANIRCKAVCQQLREQSA